MSLGSFFALPRWSPLSFRTKEQNEALRKEPAMQVSAQRAVPILLCLLAVPSFAASPRWTLLGPDGHDARFLAVAPSNPSVVYATGFAQEGIFRRLDGGAAWAPVSIPGAADSRLLAFSGARSGAAYALGGGEQLYKSTNDGASWSPVPLPPHLAFNALAVHPKDPRTLLVAAGDQGV